MSKIERIAIVDLGGQYCHLIARRLRDLDIDSEIFDASVRAPILAPYSGLILSGGPQSVYEHSAVTIDENILKLGLPVFGICYGHQLLAKLLGGEVTKHDSEYGHAQLEVKSTDAVFRETPTTQQVWMSHSDAVKTLPPGAITTASTARCEHAAFADTNKQIFGVQFHPEVVHSEYGRTILENFVRRVCGMHTHSERRNRILGLCERVREVAAGRSVFFLVSGGVDSTVAFVLCAKALGPERVLGLYVDTGFMRQGETEELRGNLGSLGLGERLVIWDASREFSKALERKTEPEEKRHIIGRLFVSVQSEAMRKFGIDSEGWLLGQGTIYPDTIESGGSSGRAAVIKTHHNRCEEIRELLRQGRVIEPLAEFYKDEVRTIGGELGLSPLITGRWPFPGPGLAIRCICTKGEGKATDLPLEVATTLRSSGYRGVLLPLQSVGVQGDARTYLKVVAIQEESDRLDYKGLRRLSSWLCNEHTEVNRVILLLAGRGRLGRARVQEKPMGRDRVEMLRIADSLARLEVENAGLRDKIWQFPVVLAPISLHDDGESIVLRPVNSEDGMTANFAELPLDVLSRISRAISKIPGIDAVFLDVTNKPPATIEWE